MGWSRLQVSDEAIGLKDGDYVYFAHSYACDSGPHTAASTDYGRDIPAAVRRDNFIGAQFHPERSGEAGHRFLKAFLDQ
jgi:glutamine amidotransferase